MTPKMSNIENVETEKTVLTDSGFEIFGCARMIPTTTDLWRGWGGGSDGWVERIMGGVFRYKCNGEVPPAGR